MSKASKNILIAVICIVLATVFWTIVIPAQVPLPKFTSGGTTPRGIPKVCCALIIVMSLLILRRSVLVEHGSFKALKDELGGMIKSKREWRTFGGVMTLFGVAVCYYIFYCKAGFFLSTLVLFPVLAFVLGCRKIVTVIAVDLMLVFTVYYFFSIFMGCYLPGWAPF